MKSGMYGEMPVVKIGKYTIAEMYEKDNCESVWIQDTDGDIGGEFHKSQLIPVIEDFFNKHF
jgi:hypothetical protein